MKLAGSSLSNICNRQDGYTIGTHPLVVHFLTGASNLLPTKPTYQETWDVKKVFCYLQTFSPVEQLTLKLLSYRLVMLIALTQTSRLESISLLSIDEMKKYILHLHCIILGYLKCVEKEKLFPLYNFLCIRLIAIFVYIGHLVNI